MGQTVATPATAGTGQASPVRLMNPVAPLALVETAAVRPALARRVTVAMEALAAPARRDRSPAARVTAQRVAWVVRAARAALQSQARLAMVATAATAVRPELAPMEQSLWCRVPPARPVAMEEFPVTAATAAPVAVQLLEKTATGAMAATGAVRGAVAMVAMARPALGCHLTAQRVETAG